MPSPPPILRQVSDRDGGGADSTTPAIRFGQLGMYVGHVRAQRVVVQG
ncbi:hypothetical protein V6Z11_D09G065600 [Gossypium hirsutum]